MLGYKAIYDGIKTTLGRGASLPRSWFCLVTQRSSRGALRDDTKTAARETRVEPAAHPYPRSPIENKVDSGIVGHILD